jgi:transcriptional regulator with XRE-family HTH domain
MDGLTNIHFDKTKFRAARERAGLRQTDAARALGISKSQLWLYESEKGRGTPSPDTLARACVLYGVEISEFTVEAQAA